MTVDALGFLLLPAAGINFFFSLRIVFPCLKNKVASFFLKKIPGYFFLVKLSTFNNGLGHRRCF